MTTSFTKSAGAKLINIFLAERARPIDENAALTFSFDSATVLSASPTIIS